MIKKVLFLLLGLSLVSGVAQARNNVKRSKVVVPVTDMLAGDYITAISNAAITDNTIPWFIKDLSRTAVVLGTVADVTATAVTFDFILPADYKGGGELYALVKPAAASWTFTLTADIQIQSNVTSSPTTSTAVVEGTSTAVVAVTSLDKINFLKLPTSAFGRGQEPNSIVSVLLKRNTGTGQNVYLHGVWFTYEPFVFQKR